MGRLWDQFGLGLLVGIILIVLGPVILNLWEWSLFRFTRRRMGLRRFARRDDCSPKILERVIFRARRDDGLLIVGRTHCGLMERFGPLIAAAVGRGVSCRVVAYSPNAAGSHEHRPPLDARLGVTGGQTRMSAEVHIGLRKLAELVMNIDKENQTADQPIGGPIEVRVTDLFIENSMFAYCAAESKKSDNVRHRMRLIYDTSFGFGEQNKYIHYFVTYKGHKNFANDAYCYCERIFGDERLSQPAFSYRPGGKVEIAPGYEMFFGPAAAWTLPA